MPAPEPNLPGDDAIEQAAANWVARRDAGLDANGTQALLDWLSADPRHEAAFKEMETAWRLFDVPRSRGQSGAAVRQLIVRQDRLRRRVVVAAGSTLVAAAAVWAVLVVPSWRSEPSAAQIHSTAAVVVLRPEHRVLEDGSIVELNRGAKIAVHYTAARRDIQLLQGDAHFTVAKNPLRPFIVSTPKTAVRAVGTVFAVSVAAAATTDVLVTEGKVAVGSDTDAAGKAVLVGAGNRLLVPANAESNAVLHVQSVSAGDIARRLAWRVPRLDLSATPLADAAAAFNRENRIQLSIVDPKLRELRLTGVFALNEVETFVRLLEANYGVKATRQGDTHILLEPSDRIP
jgi:transmembrane sensor